MVDINKKGKLLIYAPCAIGINMVFSQKNTSKMINKLFHFGIEKKIINNLKNSNKQVKIAVVWFTNPRLFNSISKLTETGLSGDLIG